MTQANKITIVVLLVLIGLMIYFFLFGKLFPYSPIVIGFEKHELANTIIYTQKGVSINDYKKIDTLITSIEKFHELEYLTKPEIFLFSDSISYARRSPSKARFTVFYNSRLFVNPRALEESQRQEISLKIYLTHELSHSLLHQNSGLLNAINYPKWLLEGIAVYSSNQMGTSFYPSKNETYHAIAQGNFLPPFDFKTDSEEKTELNVKHRITFMYSEFACIVDYLITTYGREKFLSYMKSLLKDNDHDKIFKQIYGMDFEELLIDFRQFVTENDSLKSVK